MGVIVSRSDARGLESGIGPGGRHRCLHEEVDIDSLPKSAASCASWLG